MMIMTNAFLTAVGTFSGCLLDSFNNIFSKLNRCRYAFLGDIKLSSPTLNQLLISVFLLTKVLMKWKSLDCVQAEDKYSVSF